MRTLGGNFIHLGYTRAERALEFRSIEIVLCPSYLLWLVIS